MNNRLSFLSFWSINDTLDLNTLKKQLDELRLAGLEGVIFHPRFYPNVPVYMSKDYLEIVSGLILYAKATGMMFWIYDENGWPSGTASGEVMKRHPDATCKWVEWVSTPDHGDRIELCSKQAVSSLDPVTTQMFLDITYEGYRQGLSPEAFEYVTGFFSDEVAFLDGHGITVKTGAIPWDDRLPQQYEKRYGEALLPRLPLLFTEGEGHEDFRVRYWELLTDAIVEGFYQPVAAWCETYGKKFTAHLKAEESPFFQLSYSGSGFQVLKRVETPAIDALERNPGNNFYPRIAHSVAMQQGRSGSLVEAMGGSGWGVSPESFTNYCLWLASHGIEQFVFHLNQLKLNTKAVQDWPPSMPSHVTWKDAFPALLASIKAQAALLPDLKAEPDVLIVTPTRGIMAAFDPKDSMQMNEHDGSNIPASAAGVINEKLLALVEACYAAGLHYELTEERVIEEDGLIESGFLRIGKRDYSCVLVADGCRWKEAGMLDKLRAAGINVCETQDWQLVLAEKIRAESSEGPPTAAGADVEQTKWSIQSPDTNQFYVEFQPGHEGKLGAQISLENPASIGGLTFVLLDLVEEVRINGEPFPLHFKNGGVEVLIPGDRVGLNRLLSIEVTPILGGEACPIAFLRGRFAVMSKFPLREKDERQWMADGPFDLVPVPAVIDAANLISAGFPFMGEPVIAKKIVSLHADQQGKYTGLQLTDVQGDAAQIRLACKELGWCWGPQWAVSLPEELAAGSHELEVALYPSTFNTYGPHRHYEGDRYLTSPDQYAGIKNFADHPNAPEQTRVQHAHFVKWGIAGDIQFV
ncbi:hypothetical protein P5G65_00050 [Paenibacillus chondroitinus]|uniref:Glycoside hydrolase family 42 N-terminal domain-containing protein n=1 Tax=Paenibacillus chondroitinus TaxID=59842 RepID=A0ABU6D493_9BACL|nr:MULTISPECIES: hypothetical protein [Paenibacillus]MCY9660931.1 hypothetical protein [Paenibacillus anseongense]MEB4792271.1 hypothetical protein [Paenibacillus chondroitinus]